jgi:exopolyphosphatase/guanosine-5'-triphosphate,3'-diphosphate pyrophosphatase
MVEKELMRVAVIDLGTNTFNLLIAEVNQSKLEYIHSEKLAVLLGMGGINEGHIADDAMERAKCALTQFKLKCIEKNVHSIKGIGTSALREAKNAHVLIDFARDSLQIPISIISGLDEALLIYNGVRWCHPIHYSTLIMDIGGGSTEFIHADSTGFLKAVSKNIGVSRIYQLLGKPDEYSQNHIEFITDYLNQQKCDFFESAKSTILVGSSGSFETIFEMTNKMEFPETGDSFELPIESFVEQLDWLISSTLEQRMNNEWIASIRKKMMPIAALKMKWIIEQMDIQQIYVSPYSLKEGVFMSSVVT